MHSLESVELTHCCECGTMVYPATDRAFGVDEDEFLCVECAIRRGGVYDELWDRWAVPPNLSGIPHERHMQS
jgi:recombinational DNA repair protein (RecF pathway)